MKTIISITIGVAIGVAIGLLPLRNYRLPSFLITITGGV